jgi:hypothetical protein
VSTLVALGPFQINDPADRVEGGEISNEGKLAGGGAVEPTEGIEPSSHFQNQAAALPFELRWLSTSRVCLEPPVSFIGRNGAIA